MSSCVDSIRFKLLDRHNGSETSSSSSEEEWDTIYQSRNCRPQIFNYGYVIACFTEEEFKSHYRLSRPTFNYIHDLIHDYLCKRTPGCPTIPPHHQLMIALWKMVTMDSYRLVCDRFNVGRTTAVRAVRRVTHALFLRAPKFIQWPNGARAGIVMREFDRSSGFPKVIGAVDRTHIRIYAPKKDPKDYINRNRFHSIQLQIVCDHRKLITHCHFGQPGSFHEQKVFLSSEVANYLNQDEKFPDDSHILGNAAYDIHEHLLTPFIDHEHLTDRQRNYNYRHLIARITVEKCIGLLKGRMRSLLYCLPILNVDLMAEYVIACCVIHNICILRRDDLNVITIPKSGNGNPLNDIIQNAATLKRDIIMNSLRMLI